MHLNINYHFLVCVCVGFLTALKITISFIEKHIWILYREHLFTLFYLWTCNRYWHLTVILYLESSK